MTTLTALILEDEPLVARDLQKLLLHIDPHIEVLCVIGTIHEATAWFAHNPEPDILFCDIQLADGVSFDFFEFVQVDCPVIFTTAYDEYAIRAFKLNSLDYLLKPVDREELEAALIKFRRWKAHNIQSDIRAQLANALQDIHQPQQATPRFKERFFVHGKGSMVIVPVQETAFLLKDEVIYLITLDGKRHLTEYQTMEEVEEVLNPAEFFRANRQTLVRLQAVEGFRADYTGKLHVFMRNMPNFVVDVSREKAATFKKWIG
jgi:two-component system, LytTR family, response regulator